MAKTIHAKYVKSAIAHLLRSREIFNSKHTLPYESWYNLITSPAEGASNTPAVMQLVIISPVRGGLLYMAILTASIAQVDLGAFQVDGLMDESGKFYIGIPQIADLIEINRNTASRDLKRMMGLDFQTSKFKTSIHPKAINAIPLNRFEELLFNLVLSGNEKAIALSRALVGLSLTQIYSDTFGVKFEKADREKWLTTRFKTKHDFRPLTDRLKSSGFIESWEYGKFVHTMQSRIGVEDGSRDFLEFEVLLRLERAQDRLITYMEFGLSPYDALKKLKVETL